MKIKCTHTHKYKKTEHTAFFKILSNLHGEKIFNPNNGEIYEEDQDFSLIHDDIYFPKKAEVFDGQYRDSFWNTAYNSVKNSSDYFILEVVYDLMPFKYKLTDDQQIEYISCFILNCLNKMNVIVDFALCDDEDTRLAFLHIPLIQGGKNTITKFTDEINRDLFYSVLSLDKFFWTKQINCAE